VLLQQSLGLPMFRSRRLALIWPNPSGQMSAFWSSNVPVLWRQLCRLLSAFVGRWLIDCEERIYRTLDGAEGVPSPLGRLDAQALVIEHIGGRACSDCPDGSLSPEFFQRLQHVVESIRARGVVHCDIKNRSNVVVTEDLRPYIIDFASAFTRKGRCGRLRRFALDRLRHDDQRAVVKARLLVGRIWNEEDERFACHHGPAERAVRAVRKTARRLLKLMARC
jgi:hypothetical protein